MLCATSTVHQLKKMSRERDNFDVEENGCSKWGNCFTCPASDCLVTVAELKGTRRREHKPSSQRQLDWYYKNRERILERDREKRRIARDERIRKAEESKRNGSVDL